MDLDTPIAISSLADQAFHKIANAIVSGELAPGERISEARVAKQFGISRGPLREALNRLEGRSLVSRKNNFGVSVVSLSQTDLEELFMVREVLEGLACRLATSRMSDGELKELKNLHERHALTKGLQLQEGTSYYQESADQDFHFMIVRGSGSDRLIKALCDELYYQVRIYRYRSSAQAGREIDAFKEHGQIVEAMMSRSPDRAEAAMRQHFVNARQNLKLNIDGAFSVQVRSHRTKM